MSESLDILLHGNLLWSRLGASYKRAFESLGHRVAGVDIRDRPDRLPWWLTNRFANRVTRHSRALRRWGARAWTDALLDTARTVRPDLVFILEGRYVFPRTVRELQRVAGSVVFFNADSPFADNPNSRPEHPPAAREADRFFIWSRRLARRLEETGVSPVHYLPFGWDPKWFPPAEPSPDPEHEVVFVGNWDRYRERWLEPVARRFDLKIWGAPYWKTRPRSGSALPSCWQGGRLPGPEAAEVIANARVCLNVLREQNLPDGTNMRTFEVPGCGGFLLSTRTPGAEDIFPDGEAGAYFDDRDEMLDKIDDYLTHDDERRAIAAAAHDVVANHRYLHRARDIIGTTFGTETVPSSTDSV
jgi:glycosyltransferase involved in cell wall biosynthesis